MRKGPIDTILACFENFKAAEDQDQSHTGTVHHMFGLLHDQYALQTQGNIDAIASFRRPSSEQGRSYKLLHSLHLSEQEAVHMKSEPMTKGVLWNTVLICRVFCLDREWYLFRRCEY